MIGLIIVTHASLAAELLKAAEAIVGAISHVRCHAVNSGVNLEEMQRTIQRSIDEVDVCGDGVLIMTDMFGGTPSNVSARLLQKDKVEIVNGVNLPMIIKFSSSRDSMKLAVMAKFMKKYGQKSIVLTSEILFGMES